MPPDSRRRKRLWWPILVASFLSLPQSVSATEDLTGVTCTRDPADKAACQANLNRIFGAIMEYRKRHHDKLPDRLSDLMSELIHDPKILICPYVQKNGGLRQWRKEIRELDFESGTSYGYEFPPVEFEGDLWRGLPKRTWREYKERQRERLGKLGSMVPIVRCHLHSPCLNLAFDGHIYESALYWEYNFTNVVSAVDLEPATLFADPAGRKRLVPEDFPPRDTHVPRGLLDLTDYYNGLLGDSWQGFPSNHLAGLPTGIHLFGGVPFDVRGVIQLRGEEGELPFLFPCKVEGIRVNQKCSRLHFLHGTTFDPRKRANPQPTIATYVIHYADKKSLTIPVVYGEQIADCWFDPKHPFLPTEAKVVWTGRNEAATAYGKSLRVFHATWENPLVDTEVAGISLVSSAVPSCPFLIAITVDP